MEDDGKKDLARPPALEQTAKNQLGIGERWFMEGYGTDLT